jgi:hypothetical protein
VGYGFRELPYPLKFCLHITGRAEPSRLSGGRRRTVADGVRPGRLQRLFERPPEAACRTGAGAKLNSPCWAIALYNFDSSFAAYSKSWFASSCALEIMPGVNFSL